MKAINLRGTGFDVMTKHDGQEGINERKEARTANYIGMNSLATQRDERIAAGRQIERIGGNP